MRAHQPHRRLATEPTESTDPLTTVLFWLPPPPQWGLIDAGLLRMNTGKRSGGKGTTRVGAVGRVFRGFRGYSISMELSEGIGNAIKVIIKMTFPGNAG